MPTYKKTNPELWSGRTSNLKLALHEKVELVDLEGLTKRNLSQKSIAILGYACDEGVRRNQGRVGAADGPKHIRKQLGKLPNHLDLETKLIDVGTIFCYDGDLEGAQERISEMVCLLLEKNAFPILLGGGHDIAYGHYKGLKQYLGKNKIVGIINFDAHFDLRNNENGNNSGTPFYQLAQEYRAEGTSLEYLCLGIRSDANDKLLFQTAELFETKYIENNKFVMGYAEHVVRTILDFIRNVDHVYVTIDLDGFSSSYAPGVSAASPMGFSPAIVLEALKIIIDSKKMISMDIAELNSKYDIDDRTAKLAASLAHFVIHEI
jgi:formiminoglutamase